MVMVMIMMRMRIWSCSREAICGMARLRIIEGLLNAGEGMGSTMEGAGRSGEHVD